jgi:hypothetical protein
MKYNQLLNSFYYFQENLFAVDDFTSLYKIKGAFDQININLKQ